MQGNVTLLQGLQDSARAARVLQATWRRLAARTETQAALAAIDDGVLTTTGMTLVELGDIKPTTRKLVDASYLPK